MPIPGEASKTVHEETMIVKLNEVPYSKPPLLFETP